MGGGGQKCPLPNPTYSACSVLTLFATVTMPLALAVFIQIWYGWFFTIDLDPIFQSNKLSKESIFSRASFDFFAEFLAGWQQS
jgi:hypothetical protein